MDDLIILIVRGLIRLFSGDATKQSPARRGPPSWVPPSPTSPQSPNRTVGRAPVRAGTRRPAGRRPPPLVPVAAPIITSSSTSVFPAIKVAAKPEVTAKAPTATHTISANAVAINKWLSPTTLRKQFILTEILQPPLAMRNKP
jgi:hypothetical protein